MGNEGLESLGIDRVEIARWKWDEGLLLAVGRTDSRKILEQQPYKPPPVPGSNRWIAKVLPSLPLHWTKDELEFGGMQYSAADHMPILIQPNPLATGRYVVLNTGHTFGEKELASLNYLLFPRLGDWAVLKVPTVDVVSAGFFDERWRLGSR